MSGPFLNIRRLPDDEPFYIQLDFTASNGTFSGGVRLDNRTDDFIALGQILNVFPRVLPDEYQHKIGSEEPNQRDSYYCIFRVYTINRRGNCAIQISINNRGTAPEEGICRFSIPCEPASLNRLGDLLIRFGAMEHLELHWVPNSDQSGLYKPHPMLR